MEFKNRAKEPWVLSGLAFLLSFLVSIQGSFAQDHFELTPGLSVSEVYDDNIDLDNTDEKSDYITMISPSLLFRRLSQKSDLGLRYSPTFVWYGQEEQNDTIRQSGALTLDQNLAQHLELGLTDTYLQSEDPLEETEGVEGPRNTRNKYQRNAGRAVLRYLYGPENVCSLGYGHSWLENEDITLEDRTIQTPFGSATYWFDIKNGLELDYEFTKAIFWRDDGSAPRDDYEGHGTGFRYIHRFTPHTSGFLRGRFTTLNFEGVTEDYEVHEGSVGFEEAFSPHLHVSAEGGYFTQKRDVSDDETGYTYQVSLAKDLERGSFNLGGSGGWEEDFLETEERGFTRYWELDTSIEYRLREHLSGYAGGSYRRNKDEVSREWETLRGRCGMRYAFLRWYSLSLEYTFAERDDDVDSEDYTVNRMMLTLAASRLYRW